MPAMIARTDMEFACYFEPEHLVQVDPLTFTRVNYEGFFFCQEEELERFLGDPVSFCGLLTDPVSKRRFRPGPDSPRDEHEGVPYLFESSETAKLFALAPEEFMLPGYEMGDDEDEGEAG